MTKPPIIIGGCGRSGTSLLLSVLSAHPSILAIPQETEAFCPTAWSAEVDPNSPLKPEIIDEHLASVEIPETATRWLEKSPKNVIFIRAILDHFKDRVRFINILRDGRDVVTSFHPTRRREKPWVSPERWINDVSAGRPFDDHPQVFVIKYEDLILDFEPTMARLMDFLEEELHPHVLDWHLHATVRKHVAWSGEVKKIHPASIAKWQQEEYKQYAEDLLSHPEAVELLKHYGYL